MDGKMIRKNQSVRNAKELEVCVKDRRNFTRVCIRQSYFIAISTDKILKML